MLAAKELGFSLVELMVVIAVISAFSVMTLPILLSRLPEQQLREAARILYADIQMARLLAVKENGKLRVRFVNNINNDQYYYFDKNNNNSVESGEFKRSLQGFGEIRYGCMGTKKNWNGDTINPSGLPSDPRVTFSKTGTCDARSFYLYASKGNLKICYAVTTTIYGMVKIRRFNGVAWE